MAWAKGHAEYDVEHVLDAFLEVVDVSGMLEKRGVVVADVRAILEQLLDERPRSEERGPGPELSARLDTVVNRAGAGGRIPLAPFVENLGSALPRELGFVRPALTAAAPEIDAFFSASLSHDANDHLTLEAWSDEMKAVVGLMQKSADETLKGWGIAIFHLFFAVLAAKSLHAAFRARGVDTVAIVRELTRASKAKYGSVRFAPPEDFGMSMTPALYATFIRAERYAAEDRTSVKLRHVLAAIHDEPDYAPFVVKLLG